MPKSLIELRDWSAQELKNLLQLSLSLENNSEPSPLKRHISVGLLFFEASTRTRISFEIAAHKEGCRSFLITSSGGTSIEKGESLQDTFDNIHAMKPDVLILRSDESLDQKNLALTSQLPLISAGWGKRSHPTQALLDIRALMKKNVPLTSIKLVIIGDVRHSRVASSHFQLAERLGYEVAVLCEDEFAPAENLRRFESLDQALSWGNVIMPLRFQRERHLTKVESLREQQFQICRQHLENFNTTTFLMHPGPVNYGSELNLDVKGHSQNLILSQAESGVWVRRACLRWLLEEVL